jgi:DNA-binding response OmpR family regulator
MLRCGQCQNQSVHVLVVEDDVKTAAFIRSALTETACTVDVLGNGDDALAAITQTAYDAVVLDIMLPGRDGLSVVRQLRQNQNRTSVLLLSARGAVSERVEGLEAGADDYLAKPFALEELIARVRALGRRSDDAGSLRLRMADLTLDTASRKAFRGDRRIELTTREFRLLELLMRSPDRIYGRLTILEKVWDYDFDPGSNIVDVYIRRLRSKIDEGFDVKLLHSVRGAGYLMRTPE